MTVVPRWEWRAFGAAFGEAERRLTAQTPGSVEDSRELYLLTPASDASVKLRDGVLDVKHLLAVDEHGLEQWVPVKKARLPVPAAGVAGVIATLGADIPPLVRGDYSLDELLAVLAQATPRPRLLGVRKQRARYTFAGCMAELTELDTDDGPVRTLAVESEDPARVLAALDALGLAPAANTCVARGLKALARPRFAVIDVGTNSVKLHLAERRADGWLKLVDRAEVTRLGEGLERSGRLGVDAIARTVDAVAGMVEEAERDGVAGLAAIGTAGLRIAPNAADLVEAVGRRTGVQIEVISGDDEARLAYDAATATLGPAAGSLVVFDTGGGSSQFTFADGDRISLDVGAVRFTERYGLHGITSAQRLQAALTALEAALAPLRERPRPDGVLGMGGAITNLAAVMLGLETYDPDLVHGSVLARREIDRQIASYRARDADQRRAIAGLQANRAEVILAGACIARTVLTLLQAESLTVCDRGLRHGVLAERFGAEVRSSPALGLKLTPSG